MYEFIGTIICILILLGCLFVTYLIYSKLMNYNNKLINIYNDIYKLIEEKFILVENNSLKKDTDLHELYNRFKILDYEDDVILISLELDKLIIKSYKKRKFYNEYKSIIERINVIKKEYNDNVLRFNNLIKMFPISIVSNLFGFDTWLYYRNDY